MADRRVTAARPDLAAAHLKGVVDAPHFAEGQVMTIVGMVNFMASMMALDAVAAERSVFSDMVITGKDGRPPQLLSGDWKDGRTGEVNLIMDGEFKRLPDSPGPLTSPILDRLERAARISSGNPAMMGGELNGALRSGQTVSALGGMSVDPRIQEAQMTMQRSLVNVNTAIQETEKGWWPAKKYVVFSGWASDLDFVHYTPAEDFAETATAVVYPAPGMDASQLTTMASALVGCSPPPSPHSPHRRSIASARSIARRCSASGSCWRGCGSPRRSSGSGCARRCARTAPNTSRRARFPDAPTARAGAPGRADRPRQRSGRWPR
jgi:hypothetical protein